MGTLRLTMVPDLHVRRGGDGKGGRFRALEVAGTIEEDAREYIPVGLGQRHPWRCTPPQ